MDMDMVTTHDNEISETRALGDLGRAVAAGGIDADPVALLLLAHAARDLGIDEVLVGVMVDVDEPAVARVRAFGRVSVLVSVAMDGERPVVRELQPAC